MSKSESELTKEDSRESLDVSNGSEDLKEIPDIKDPCNKLAHDLFANLNVRIGQDQKLITILGTTYQLKAKSSKNGEGVSPGWMLFAEDAKFNQLPPPKPIGMIKFPKSGLFQSSLEDEYIILGELLAVGFAEILGFKRSNCQLISVTTTDENPKTALFSLFNHTKSLEELLAGNKSSRNNGVLKPTGEGFVAPSHEFIEDLSRYLIYLFILNDNDAIGKVGNNAAFIADDKNPDLLRLFIYDKTFCLDVASDYVMHVDQRLNIWTDYYKKRMNPGVSYIDAIGRHGAMRNFSVITDGEFLEKFSAFLNFQKQFPQIKNFLAKTAEKIKKNFAAPAEQKRCQAYLSKLTAVEKQLDQRWTKLQERFASTLELYENLDRDAESLAAMINLELQLSPTTMYSEEGISLRTMQVSDAKDRAIISVKPYKDRNFLVLTVTNSKENLTEVPNFYEHLTPKEPSSYLIHIKLWESFKETLKTEFSPLRVRMRKHPETLPFSAFTDAKLDVPKHFLISPQNIKKNQSEFCKKYPDFLKVYNLFYQKNLQKSDAKDTLGRIATLSQLHKWIQNYSSSASIKNNHGFWQHLIAAVLKEQQLAFIIILTRNPAVIGKLRFNEKQDSLSCLYDFFNKAHALDLNLSINRLLLTAIKFQQLNHPAFLNFLEQFQLKHDPQDYDHAAHIAKSLQTKIDSLVLILQTATESLSKAGMFAGDRLSYPSSSQQSVVVSSFPS